MQYEPFKNVEVRKRIIHVQELNSYVRVHTRTCVFLYICGPYNKCNTIFRQVYKYEIWNKYKTGGTCPDDFPIQ